MRGERTVLVTGGTKRIGKAISDALRADGWRVITSSHREDAGADIVADLAEPLGAAKLYSACLRMLGGNPPDALVNNAALFVGDDATIEAVNFEAPRKLTTLMAGRETGRGAVVNILDCRVLGGMEPRDAYEKSKCELLENTTKSAALFADTIRVNAVAPHEIEISLENNANATKQYAIMDMKGQVLSIGSLSSGNTRVKVPTSGSYIVKVGHECKRINMR